jgi:hypothetical protein
MSDTLLLRFRTILLLGMTMLALAISAGPAFAGEDDDGDDDDAPVPAQVTPAPVPVKPAPAQPAPAQPAPAAQPQHSPTTRNAVRHTQVQRTARVTQTRQTTTALGAGQTVPRGGIQTGAGGTAPELASRPPLALVASGLLLALLAIGGGVRLAHVSARR